MSCHTLLCHVQECVRTLALLPLPSCPVADVALQQHLPKILVYLRKTLQVWHRCDSVMSVCGAPKRHSTRQLGACIVLWVVVACGVR